MSLDAPPYITQLRHPDQPLRYTWDDWDFEAAERPIDKSLLLRLQALGQRANVAFCIGCAEWIAYPLRSLLNDDFAFQRLEAAWAQVIDPRYAWALIETPQQWAGPVRRPVRRAIELVQDSVEAMRLDQSPAACGSTLSALVLHLLEDPVPFRQWQHAVVDRLTQLYPLNPNETMGEVLPREALDPTRPFDIEQTQDLVQNFLDRVSQAENPFFRARREMIDEGFVGMPYWFDVQEDRKMRFEW